MLLSPFIIFVKRYQIYQNLTDQPGITNIRLHLR